MKFLVVVSALIAVAAAFPSDVTRAKRGVFGFGGYGGDFGGFGGHGAFGGYGGYGAYGGYGGYDGLGAVVKGPSGVIAANTGAVHGFGGGHAVVSGPAAGHAVVSGPAAGHAVVSGPAAGHAVVAAPAPVHAAVVAGGAHGYAGAGHHGAASINTAPQVAGVVNSPSATLIGPSTDGHPGAIIPKGYTGVYGYGHGHGHGAGAHGGYWG